MMEKSSSIAQDKTKRIIIIADQEMWELWKAGFYLCMLHTTLDSIILQRC
jgi:hypothetical protein